MNKIRLSLFAITCFIVFNVQAQSKIFVNDSNATQGNGSSWNTAYQSFQTALDSASAGDTIWVARGSYYPSKALNNSIDNRSKTFYLKDNLSIYGGFIGNETSLSQRVLNDTNKSIFSGDLGVLNDSSDNSYHVFVGFKIQNVILNGLSIEAGNANGIVADTLGTDTISRNYGGGIYLDSSSVQFEWVNFDANYAKIGGAAMNIKNCDSLTINSCQFVNNIIDGNGFDPDNGGGGAGIRNENSHPILNSVLFQKNDSYSVQGGGAMRNEGSNPILDNVSFIQNYCQDGDGGGAVYNLNSDPIFTNVLFDSNTTLGEAGAVYSDGSNPEFTNVTFESNSCGTNGGGAMENDKGTAILYQVLFLNNSSLGDGGAIQNWKSSIELTDVTFEGNTAVGNGGAILNYTDCSPTMNRVVFRTNSAGDNGGAIYNERNSNPIITNTLIYENNAGNRGGGIYTTDGAAASSPILTNVTITQNRADSSGGGGYDDGQGNTKLRNSIVYGNYAPTLEDIDAPLSMLQSAVFNDIIGNERYINGSTAPVSFSVLVFTDSLNNDFSLAANGPAINTGDSTLYNVTNTPDLSGILTDIRGADRIMGSNVDIGAYEFCSDTILPTVGLSSSHSFPIVTQTAVTFTAGVTNEGINPSFVWYKNGVVIPMAVDSQYTGTAGLDFITGDSISVLLSSSIPCATDSILSNQVQVLINPVGIANVNQKESTLLLYPNPSNGIFTVKSSVKKGIGYSITITDLTGRTIYQENFTNTSNILQKEMQLNLTKGYYFLSITSAKNEKQLTPFIVD